MATRARDLNNGVLARIDAFALVVLGSDGEEAVARATYALASAPTGAVQRYIAARQRPPGVVDDMVRETYRAVIVGPARRRSAQMANR